MRQAWPFPLFHKQGKQVWCAWGHAYGHTQALAAECEFASKGGGLGLYFPPWCPARHDEYMEANCFYLGPLYLVQEFMQCPLSSRGGVLHLSKAPGHRFAYIHLSCVYLLGVASLSQAPKSGKGLYFLLFQALRTEFRGIPHPERDAALYKDVWLKGVGTLGEKP